MKPGYLAIAVLVAFALRGTLSSGAEDSSTESQPASPQAIHYESHISAGGVLPPGATLSNPHRGDEQTAETGARLFVTMNCDGCHGGGAVGWVGPSLADGRWRYGGADGAIFQSIFFGRPKGMPAYGGMLGTEGVWTLVTYLQSLPVPENVPTQSWEKH